MVWAFCLLMLLWLVSAERSVIAGTVSTANLPQATESQD
jgi:hypothetical protein